MISQILDYTEQFNKDYSFVIDVSGYDYIVVQYVNQTAADIPFSSTNNGGAIEGVRDGSTQHATDFTAIAFEDLLNGNFNTYGSAISAMYRSVNPSGQYLRIGGAFPNSVDKMIIFLSKIY